MNKELAQQIFDKQQMLEDVPPNSVISDWASRLICLLYPELSDNNKKGTQEIEATFKVLQSELAVMLRATKACCNCDIDKVAADFFKAVPELYRILNTDVSAILNGDPAAKSEFEIIRAYPGFYALCFYRIAHLLLLLDIPLLPRILTEHAHSKTGIDIHPGAVIGEHFYVDHGTGIVIGETAIIGSHVKLYQGVTLGALSVDKSMASTKRHPTIEDNVIIYSNATVLGGNTVIGRNSIIGGNVWLTGSVKPGSLVYHNSEIIIEERKLKSY
ncbi:MAG: serine acetyltransferase [Terrimonas sp.]|uniref:serine O-acetyltransferase EpsC n=1 Tax=Terrimonas sp. TaxID=1914338 RepID=UPI00092A7701|nr:serine O-acetyltransferase EpsC [Terrimonas sp.]MBN8789957.1 serine acetyltransferase [Terrimonas sp.]OJY93558.1 MAG: serine acetyltransferase [Sphingobacteriales bacterium 40-81]PVD53036.1 serine acetyltransferase [Terrimonas sp.]